ncbi:Pkinase-domain-containing protein [Agrocybe pediades]|nr:Pkinase-domain-containing protein [Agrocybe pediades]
MSSVPFLENYEPLDVIGNGSFGIIRKVRRKSDGLIFARKELNFERMTERDRKQIVAEVNILKDLHHDHIVRYHDRYVDRDAGILYILMEYCGGGDLSTIIKQAAKQNRPIPEDTIWHYFLQILHALHHCHHPNSHGRSSSGSANGGFDTETGSRRPQILHRDLKPDNVFLDENNTVKLGDFGLSKALAQASFASTYVGTPYYMSPELMQERAYDSKSDIWSLGCLIYELCALKPPFHEAKTHSELSIFIRNGRIPPLPRGYSQALNSVIKSMLNLNPAMRPSAAQLLQHERLELVNKVSETEKMLYIVKNHRSTLAAKERELQAREKVMLEKEQCLASLLQQKDQEIHTLQQFVAQLQQAQQTPQFSRQDVELAIKQAVAKREEELRVLILKHEQEVAVAMAKREEEIIEAVRAREVEVDQACAQREQLIRKEVDERIQWVIHRETELRAEETRLEEAKADLEANMKKFEQNMASAKGRKDKNPLEEVKNLLEPLSRAQATPTQQRRRKLDTQPKPRPIASQYPPNALETPVTRPPVSDYMPSAMKGVVLTSTGEVLATPSPAELVKLFNKSPKVGLNFGKIFDFEDDNDKKGGLVDGLESPPPSPSVRKERGADKSHSDRDRDDTTTSSSSSSSSTGATTNSGSLAPPQPTRIRRPSIRTARTASSRSSAASAAATASRRSGSESSATSSSAATSSSHNHNHTQAKPLPHPHLRPSSINNNLTSTRPAPAPLPIPVPRSHPSPEYDFADEENLPSPFLKRIERSSSASSSSKGSAIMMKAASASSASVCSTSSSSLQSTASSMSSTGSAGSAGGGNSSGNSSSTTVTTTSGATGSANPKRRGSSGLLLRAVAAANNAGHRSGVSPGGISPDKEDGNSYMGVPFPGENNLGTGIADSSARPSLASARKASEEARKALLRS